LAWPGSHPPVGGNLCSLIQIKALLYIPKGKRLLALVPIGVPAEQPGIEKRPLESVLHWQVY